MSRYLRMPPDDSVVPSFSLNFLAIRCPIIEVPTCIVPTTEQSPIERINWLRMNKSLRRIYFSTPQLAFEFFQIRRGKKKWAFLKNPRQRSENLRNGDEVQYLHLIFYSCSYGRTMRLNGFFGLSIPRLDLLVDKSKERAARFPRYSSGADKAIASYTPLSRQIEGRDLGRLGNAHVLSIIRRIPPLAGIFRLVTFENAFLSPPGPHTVKRFKLYEGATRVPHPPHTSCFLICQRPIEPASFLAPASMPPNSSSSSVLFSTRT